MDYINDTPKTANTAKKRRAVANFSLFMITFSLMIALMLLIRTLAISIHSVTGDGLAPLYQSGDRLLINRCSYGLRIEGNALLPYSRLLRTPVKKGDIVAFTLPSDSPLATTPDESSTATTPDASASGLMIARCTATPGDTIRTKEGSVLVPGLTTCAQTDYYWLEAINKQNPIDSRYLGFIPESHIIGRVVTVLYNRNNTLLP